MKNSIRTHSWLTLATSAIVAFALGACSPAQPASDGGNDSSTQDSAAQSKPTCEAIAERCHPYDGTDPTATMCHRAVEAPTATEAMCMGLLTQCNAACPEGDGGHSHGEDASADASADAGHSHDEDASSTGG